MLEKRDNWWSHEQGVCGVRGISWRNPLFLQLPHQRLQAIDFREKILATGLRCFLTDVRLASEALKRPLGFAVYNAFPGRVSSMFFKKALS